MKESKVKTAEERQENARKMLDGQADKDYRSSPTFSASSTGCDGIPHVRYTAISKLMVRFSDEENIQLQSHITKLEQQVSDLETALIITKNSRKSHIEKNKVLELRVKELEEALQWVSVEDRLPSENEEVICSFEYCIRHENRDIIESGVTSAIFTKHEVLRPIFVKDNGWVVLNITHWKSLPLSPEIAEQALNKKQ